MNTRVHLLLTAALACGVGGSAIDSWIERLDPRRAARIQFALNSPVDPWGSTWRSWRGGVQSLGPNRVDEHGAGDDVLFVLGSVSLDACQDEGWRGMARWHLAQSAFVFSEAGEPRCRWELEPLELALLNATPISMSVAILLMLVSVLSVGRGALASPRSGCEGASARRCAS